MIGPADSAGRAMALGLRYRFRYEAAGRTMEAIGTFRDFQVSRWDWTLSFSYEPVDEGGITVRVVDRPTETLDPIQLPRVVQ